MCTESKEQKARPAADPVTFELQVQGLPMVSVLMLGVGAASCILGSVGKRQKKGFSACISVIV